MATNIKETAGEGHNNGPMSDEDKMDAIKTLDEELIPLEIAATAAQKAVTKKHRDFKTATGITRKDFDFGRRLGKIEDEDEQKTKTDHVKLVFNALSEGSQLDFFDAKEGK